jgi:hypothetical protein
MPSIPFSLVLVVGVVSMYICCLLSGFGEKIFNASINLASLDCGIVFKIECSCGDFSTS